MEYSWEKSVEVTVALLVDMALLDEKKQPELMHTNEWFGPLLSLFRVPGIAIGLGDNGVVEVRNGGHVPGAGVVERARRLRVS